MVIKGNSDVLSYGRSMTIKGNSSVPSYGHIMAIGGFLKKLSSINGQLNTRDMDLF